MMTEQRTREASSHTKKPRRNYLLPTTASVSSHFPRICCDSRRHYFSVTSIILFWLVILVCCSPNYVANGLPLSLTDSSSPYEAKDAYMGLPLTYRGDDGEQAPNRWWHWHLPKQEDTNKLVQEMDGDDGDDNDSIQETTRLDKATSNARTLMALRPRKKKGLSYLTKYYTEAFLNNTPSSVGGGSSSANAISSAQSQHDISNHFFGISSTGNIHSSREQRFPSSVRRKLSFYPSMTSHSTFMGPWTTPSRMSSSSSGHVGTGRSPTMRLRWGK